MDTPLKGQLLAGQYIKYHESSYTNPTTGITNHRRSLVFKVDLSALKTDGVYVSLAENEPTPDLEKNAYYLVPVEIGSSATSRNLYYNLRLDLPIQPMPEAA